VDLKKAKQKKTQLDKFKELAREIGADENEAAFVGKLRRIAGVKRREPKPKTSAK